MGLPELKHNNNIRLNKGMSTSYKNLQYFFSLTTVAMTIGVVRNPLCKLAVFGSWEYLRRVSLLSKE